jgi:4-amino-4-deoxy-L-arabinose transferase-like glycosyltransferase
MNMDSFFKKIKRTVASRQFIAVAILALAALIIRIAVAWPGLDKAPGHFCRPDSAGYIQPALALVEDGGFYGCPGSKSPNASRAPGFSLFLALFFYLFGENYVIPILAMCLVGALICVPAYLTGRLFGGHPAGMIAAGFVALNITAVAMSPMYLSDSFFTFFIAWQLYFFSLFYVRKDLRWCYPGIILSALSALIRPISILWYIPASFLILIAPGINLKKKIITALTCAAVFWAIVFPWMLRNSCAGAGFCVDTNTGAMYHQNGAMLISAVKGTSYEAEKQRILKELKQEFADTVKYSDEKSRVDYRLKKLKELIAQHPLAYLRLHLNPQVMLPDAPTFFEVLGFTQSDRGTLDVMHRFGVFAAANHYFGGKLWLLALLIPALIIVLCCYIGCLVQLGVWLFEKKIFLFFFFLAFAEYYLLLPGPITVPRYHLPALPLIAVMGATGCIICVKKLKAFRKKLKPV